MAKLKLFILVIQLIYEYTQWAVWKSFNCKWALIEYNELQPYNKKEIKKHKYD